MIAFFAQTQPHLAAVALRLESDASLGDVTLLTADGEPRLLFSGGTVALPLPARPTAPQLGFTRTDARYEARVPVHLVQRGIDILRPPVSAEELNTRRVHSARCAVCRETIWTAVVSQEPRRIPHTPPTSKRRRTSPAPASTGEPYTFRALPSAHWAESTEAWLCHPSGEFTRKLQGVMQRGLWPRRVVGLVAERWVAVAPEGGGDVQMEPSLTTWLPLCCPAPSCGSSLGTRNVRALTDDEDAEDALDDGVMHVGGERVTETWRLDKYAVEFLGPDSDNPLSCNVDEILATEMLEHAQSLGVRKFRLSDEVTGEEQMALWLFNPDTDITWGTIDYDSHLNEWATHARSGRFVTVLWQDTRQTNRPPLSERYETLEYPAAAVETIRAFLAGKTDVVPADGMKMGEWQVGYLRR